MTGRTRTLTLLRDDVRKDADIVGATARHPDSDLTRYLNQGGARLRNLLIEIRGRTYFRETPHTFTTDGVNTRYDLPTGFFQLLGLRDDHGTELVTFSAQDEVHLRAISSAGLARCYELQASAIELLPLPAADVVMTLDWIKSYTDLVSDADQFEGFDGWEDYPVAYAVRKVALRDQEYELAASAKATLDELTDQIRKLAPRRDQFRPERVRNVRNRGLRRWF